MTRVELGAVRSALEELEYPVTRPEAAEALQGTTLEFAGGTDDLGALVSETGGDSFESAEAVESALHDVLG
jgi:hypothetical protein